MVAAHFAVVASENNQRVVVLAGGFEVGDDTPSASSTSVIMP